jgi:multidrug efflux pump subunit AcrA (membrane-fusion protein)
MANFDRQASAVARARLAQSRAQQMLVERQLDQSRLKAPIAGLVLNADPGNTLGAPVSRGDTLFEIAPADGYEVHLLVNESDVRDIDVGQSGELSLRARPDEALALTVLSVHPIAETGNGSSRFRVRASLSDHMNGAESPLHAGVSGQARLEAGSKSLVRILFDPLWRRLTELKWRLIG